MPGWLKTENRQYHLAALCLLIIMAALLFGTATHNSPTVDEPVLMTCGLSYWWTKDTRLNYTHPPLAHILFSLPVALLYSPVDMRSLPGWQQGHYQRATVHYMERDYKQARAQIMLCRKFIVVMTLLMGLCLYLWCKKIYGIRTATSALFLYAFNPIVLANGSLATSDIINTLTIMLSLGTFYYYLNRKGFLSLLFTSIAIAIALTAKYNAVLLLPLCALFALIYSLKGLGRFAYPNFAKRTLRLLLECSFCLLIILIFINGVYRFQNTGMNVQGILEQEEPLEPLVQSSRGHLIEDYTPLSLLPSWMPIPVPYQYIFGIASQRLHNHEGHRSYFMGMIRQKGWFYYHPVMLTIKNPLGMILLLVLSIWLLVANKRFPSIATFLLFAFALIYLGFYIASSINIGVRYTLPVLPILIFFAARGFDLAWKKWLGNTWAKALLGALLVSVFFAVIHSYPHYLGFFNSLAGGRGNKISVVGEDWGQDIGALAKYVKAKGSPRLYYDRFTTTQKLELTHFGVEFISYRCKQKIKRPAWVAVHGMEVLRKANPLRCYPFMKNRKPDKKINHHIWIYKLKK